MVDLAKIRKKVKGKGQKAEEAPVEPAVSESPSLPVAESTPALPLEDSKTRRLEDSVQRLERFKSEAGTRRYVAETKAADQAAHHLELLTFLIAGEQYAIEIEKIVEIVTPRPITRIPNAEEAVVGIISLRGTIVTLVDVRRKLRHPPSPDGNTTSRIVVIDQRKETVGFVVDRVLRVVKIAPSEVEPHPVVHTTELEESIRGVFRASGALTILLDLDKLLDHSQWT